jgi:hypothetical protein
MGLFEIRPLVKASAMQRLLRQVPKENAIIELNNLLVKGDFRQLSGRDISDIESRYALDLYSDFALNMQEFYAVQLNDFLKEGPLDDIQLEILSQLGGLLKLPNRRIDFLNEEIGCLAYKRLLEIYISTGALSASDQSLLNRLSTQLSLSKKRVEQISLDSRTKYVSERFTKLIAKKRVSPLADRSFQQIAAGLGINIDMDTVGKRAYDQYKYYWRLENEELSTTVAVVALQKSELCYLHIHGAGWYEPRAVRSSNGGTYEKLISSGPVYLTQKRLLHFGAEKNHVIKLDDIVRVTKVQGGVKIQKLTDKTPTLKMNEHDAEVLLIIIKRLSGMS